MAIVVVLISRLKLTRVDRGDLLAQAVVNGLRRRVVRIESLGQAAVAIVSVRGRECLRRAAGKRPRPPIRSLPVRKAFPPSIHD